MNRKCVDSFQTKNSAHPFYSSTVLRLNLEEFKIDFFDVYLIIMCLRTKAEQEATYVWFRFKCIARCKTDIKKVIQQWQHCKCGTFDTDSLLSQK